MWFVLFIKEFIKNVLSVHEGKKPFICSICARRFSKKFERKQPFEMVHEGKKPFQCKTCEARFSLKSTMKENFYSVHEERKRFICKIFYEKYQTLSDLNYHNLKFHERKKPYTCSSSWIGRMKSIKHEISIIIQGLLKIWTEHSHWFLLNWKPVEVSQQKFQDFYN